MFMVRRILSKAILIFLILFILLNIYNFIKIRLTTMDLPKGKIVFASIADGDYDIYTINTNGTYLRKLTKNSATRKNIATDDDPTFSPDGKKIAFVSDRFSEDKPFSDNRRPIDGRSNDYISELFIMNTNGTEQVPLTYKEENNQMPIFSPDGEKIIFAVNLDRWYTKIVNIDDKRQYWLYVGGWPRIFSPDSQRIFNTSKRDISVMDTDGTNQKRLTNLFSDEEIASPDRRVSPHKNISELCISPDGKKMAFVLVNSKEFLPGRYRDFFNFYIMNTDGSNLEKIYNIGDREIVLGHISGMKLSPDGGNIVFLGQINGSEYKPGIYSLNLRSKILASLTKGEYKKVNIKRFAFTPDGKRIIFIADMQKDTRWFMFLSKLKVNTGLLTVLLGMTGSLYDKYIFIMDIDGSNCRRIARLPGYSEIGIHSDFVHWE